jgi:hypothetical protein
VLPLPPRGDCEAVGQGAAEAERAAVAEAPPEAQPEPLTVTAAVALQLTVGVPPLECVSAALRDEPNDEDAEVDADADAATLSVPIWELVARPVRDPPAVVADARGEDEFIEDALMECEGLPVSKGELLCVFAGEAVESTGVAVPKLGDAFGDAETELEFHAEVEAAAVRDELAVAEWTELGLALAIGDAVPAPLLLAAPLALAQLDAQKVVVGEGVCNAVSEAVLVALLDCVARPLPLPVLLALAQTDTVALAEVVIEPLRDSHGDAEAREDGVAGAEGEGGGLALADSVSLCRTEGVNEAEGHSVGVADNCGETLARGEAEAPALSEGRSEVLTVPQAETMGLPLETCVGEAELECEIDPPGEFVSVVSADEEARPEAEAPPLRVEAPEALPLAQEEAEALPEVLKTTEALNVPVPRPLAEKGGEPVAEPVGEPSAADAEVVKVSVRAVVPETVGDALPDVVPVARGENEEGAETVALGDAPLLSEPEGDIKGLADGGALPLAPVEREAATVAQALPEGVPEGSSEPVPHAEVVGDCVDAALGDAAADCEGLKVATLLLLTAPEGVPPTVGVTTTLPLPEKEAELHAEGV